MISPCETTAVAFRLLRLLQDGAFHPASELAREMAIADSAVTGSVDVLRRLGVAVRRSAGRGYRLVGAIDWLDRDKVMSLLGELAPAFEVEIHDSVASTNTLLMQRSAAGARTGLCAAAEWQSDGRGRRGRTWHSSLGGALTFSLLWRFAGGAASLAGLSLAVGVAIARVLEAAGAANIELKWPNDLLSRNCKVGGILIEIEGGSPTASSAIIGIGLNVALAAKVKLGIDQAATDLTEAMGRCPDRNQLLALLLGRLHATLVRFAVEGLEPFRADWLHYNVHQNREVNVTTPDGAQVRGRVLGIAHDGALLLATVSGERRYTVGDISLRASA
jgi:BirA family transcriptional regulator, biotin operon repressor / biotin---[acetyl-CoA-carboxylase] ligase